MLKTSFDTLRYMDHAEDSASRKPLAAEEEEEIRTLFPSYENGDFVRFGKIGFVFPARFDLARIKSFPVYDDDVWLLTVPKSGTTRTGRGLGPARKARGPARDPNSPARPGLRVPARQCKKIIKKWGYFGNKILFFKKM